MSRIIVPKKNFQFRYPKSNNIYAAHTKSKSKNSKRSSTSSWHSRKIANSKIELACHTQEAETDRTRTCNTDGTCRISTHVVAVARIVARALAETCLFCMSQVLLATFDFHFVSRVLAAVCAVVRCRSRGSAASAARSECTLRSSSLPVERKSITPASRRPPPHTRSRPR